MTSVQNNFWAWLAAAEEVLTILKQIFLSFIRVVELFCELVRNLLHRFWTLDFWFSAPGSQLNFPRNHNLNCGMFRFTMHVWPYLRSSSSKVQSTIINWFNITKSYMYGHLKSLSFILGHHLQLFMCINCL